MISLPALLLDFALLSLLAFGGGAAVLPEMHRLVVEQHQWIDERSFAQLFALAQAAPGPNILVVSLIGLHLAGVSGFFALTLAFCLPSGCLMFAFSRFWQRHQGAAWRAPLQAAVAPLAAGLVLAGGVLMVHTVWRTSGAPALVWALSSAALSLALPWHPLWWIALGAALGVFGVI